ncbi:UvrD-helicase domain-containing protein [Actinotalea ferrariae]|uniref:UvrD-helicase domain-containing protein n=1 Tax=Actinotalea ferrariae TaxID=1386098 RepID=UPI001C8B798B|nr:UvrD-helicase domain-containing protein [Actinotalea ferrariae]MBX9245521.1 UvrD-helicase domain-containing protein [Actinotalea ferrariae]
MSAEPSTAAATTGAGSAAQLAGESPTDASAEPVFDVCGPLPQGTTMLEASAGTGKTFTIAALATRYVAEGLAELSELMLITFGRAATSELRDRVRERLVATERALRDPAVRASDDALLRHLADVDDAELARRRTRLTRALAQFDAATIATTHGFCQQMLTALGMAADVDHDAVLVPDQADLVDEVVDDLYLRRYVGDPEPAITIGEARIVARAAVSDHDADLRPDDPEPGSPAEHRVRFAAAVRAEMLRRKRARRVLDYDDLLVLLRDALTHPQTGPSAAERVRARYRVVMVDEFQDTDQVQWEILRTAFHGHRTLVLIGDPKQAIYAFRGADVVTYLAAKGEAHATATLGRNWRSDEDVLTGLGTVLHGAALGDERIVVRPVDAQHTGRRLEGSPPVRLRQVTRAATGPGSALPSVGAVRAVIYADVVAEVVRSLGADRLHDDDGWRPLRPGDIAVLARRNADAVAVRDALAAAGVPAVVSGLSSVFGTTAARHWLTLLTSLAQPGSSGRAAAAALTPFVGWDAARLASAPEADRDALADRLRVWAHLLAERGVATLVEATDAAGLTERLLSTEGGERMLTDVRHIGQALHEVVVTQRLGTSALTEWLATRIAETDQDYAEERSRRLETDAAAVQVVTIHSSKGLEFPVVHVPFAWDRYAASGQPVLKYHDDADRRLLHVGGLKDTTYADARNRHLAEEQGEDLRLTYVALTRASSQVVMWWAPTKNAATGPLSRLLLGPRTPGVEPLPAITVPKDAQVEAAFARIAEESGGTITHELVTAVPTGTRWEPPTATPPPLDVARFTRHLDTAWRRTSYSGLTAAAHEAAHGVADEPETTGIQDEADTPATVDPAAAVVGAVDPAAGVGTSDRAAFESLDPAWPEALRALRSPMADLPGGTTFGTLVHEVLEHVDTDTSELDAELLRRCREASLSRGLGVDPDALAAALAPVMRTPLGDLAGGRTLADVAPKDRLPEMVFELPLAGGEVGARAGGQRGAVLRDVATLLRRHLPADDPFAPYADRLDSPLLGTERLRGYLTGSIDAVLRVAADDGTPRHLVVDYKTNRLAPASEDLTLWHYRPEAMAAAMIDAHYPLQLLLYTVALHRFLRWRQPGYDPDRHLGGGLYLFVRGMAGPTTPVVDGMPCGVMAWRPPTELVLDLSALLDGRTP